MGLPFVNVSCVPTAKCLPVARAGAQSWFAVPGDANLREVADHLRAHRLCEGSVRGRPAQVGCHRPAEDRELWAPERPCAQGGAHRAVRVRVSPACSCGRVRGE